MRDTFWGMPLWLGVLVAVMIIFVRGQVYYWIGRGLGERIYTSRAARRIGEERIRKVEGIVARRGALAVLAAHWVAGLRHAIPISAGAARMPLPRYIVASALGSILWTPPWVVGGYAVIWGWLEIFGRSPLAAAALAVALAAVIAALVVLRRRRRRASREEPGAPAPAEGSGAPAPAEEPGAPASGEGSADVASTEEPEPDGTGSTRESGATVWPGD